MLLQVISISVLGWRAWRYAVMLPMAAESETDNKKAPQCGAVGVLLAMRKPGLLARFKNPAPHGAAYIGPTTGVGGYFDCTVYRFCCINKAARFTGAQHLFKLYQWGHLLPVLAGHFDELI